jgi:hypothetical protein
MADKAPRFFGNTSLTSLLHSSTGGGASWTLDTCNVMDHLGSVRVGDPDS